VILTTDITNVITILSPIDSNHQVETAPLYTFDPRIVDFLNTLCHNLLENKSAKKYSDIGTFAFWCRSASIKLMKDKNQSSDLKLGLGIVFHIAPSNVPINFAYSLVIGLLSGNSNIVRVSSKEFPQTKIICDTLNSLLEIRDYDFLKKRITIIQYDHDEKINNYFSNLCDARVIWGGDLTIRDIQKSKIPIRSREIVFSDRYSLCIINSKFYLDTNKDISYDFYNDTYLTDQNACTSPHLIIWIGSVIDNEKAQIKFWDKLCNIVKERYILHPISVIDKYCNAIDLALHNKLTKIIKIKNNYITRCEVTSLSDGLVGYKSNSGFFIEYKTDSLECMNTIITNRFQTLSYYGFDSMNLYKFIQKNKFKGIDRVVPIGKTMDFSYIWDGYNLIDSLSRIVDIK
jgi:hypothetical protein